MSEWCIVNIPTCLCYNLIFCKKSHKGTFKNLFGMFSFCTVVSYSCVYLFRRFNIMGNLQDTRWHSYATWVWDIFAFFMCYNILVLQYFSVFQNTIKNPFFAYDESIKVFLDVLPCVDVYFPWWKSLTVFSVTSDR